MPQEKTVGNTYDANIKLHFDCSRVLQSGWLENTINYGELALLARSEIEKPCELLEETVGRLRNAIVQKYPQVTGGTIALYKIHPPIAVELARVGFELSW